MAFAIEPLSLTEFLTAPKIRLPRFQRKETWDEKRNFRLCISVFKGYPVGVVIYNCTKDEQWLLDGRQRRNALKTAWENPVNLYNYAKALLGFKPNSSPDEIRGLFWKGVDAFLQQDKSGNDGNVADCDAENDIVDIDLDPEEMRGNLEILLKLIQMVHKAPKDKPSEWEKRFDFTEFVTFLPYLDNSGKVDPKKLKIQLLNWGSECQNFTVDQFVQEINRYPLRDGVTRGALEEHIRQNFERIKDDIETIRKADSIFREARIGLIKLNNVSPLDAQNIFSLVNSGGTQLKAEELLSAKPFWNRLIQHPITGDVRTLINNLYNDLGIPGENAPVPNAPVYWDICATMLDRIDKNHLFFPQSFQTGKGDRIDIDKIVLGFKLASAVICGGTSAKHIEKMEDRNVCGDWEGAIQTLIDDVSRISEILVDVNFFRNLIVDWKKSVWNLLGNNATLEFVAILLKNWRELGSPTVDGTTRKKFVGNSLVLFDKLIYEYSCNQWRGSGDSKVARHIKDIAGRLTATPKKSWEALVNDSCLSNNDSYTNLTSMLFYFTVLQQKHPAGLAQTTYDVDHIVPQSLLEANPDDELKKLKNTLGNLALLPHRANIKKSDELLKNIESDLRAEVAKYSDIKLEDFEKYSDVTNLKELCEKRKQMFLNVVNNDRTSLFGNFGLV